MYNIIDGVNESNRDIMLQLAVELYVFYFSYEKLQVMWLQFLKNLVSFLFSLNNHGSQGACFIFMICSHTQIVKSRVYMRNSIQFTGHNISACLCLYQSSQERRAFYFSLF